MKTRREGKMPVIILLGVFLLANLGFSLANPQKAAAGLADHAVINEVHIDSVVGTGGTDDDWVELFNPTSTAVSLDGWSIQKTAGTGGTLVNAALSGTIPAGGYFLIVRNGAVTAQALKDAADLLVSDSFSLSGGNIVYLAGSADNITDAADPDIVDFVGWGTASYYEGAAAAPAISETKSISRVPDGEDTDENSADFILQDMPTPNNSSAVGENNIGGDVVLTVTPDAVPTQNLTAVSADIVFQVNTDGTALVKYGLDNAYGSLTQAEVVAQNVTKAISLTGLACNTTYHYAIYAENSGATENDQTADATFSTWPCGLALNNLAMTKTTAKANNQYLSGWEWEFDLTVWDPAETSLKMKFNAWSGPSALTAAGNMQYSADNGATWIDITADNAYPVGSSDLTGLDLSPDPGRQVKVIVRMKVPIGTPAGHYDSSYGILTE